MRILVRRARAVVRPVIAKSGRHHRDHTAPARDTVVARQGLTTISGYRGIAISGRTRFNVWTLVRALSRQEI
jgi:hypothetical protein